MTRYEQGFLTKCAEFGVDGAALLMMAKSAANASFRSGMTMKPGGTASFRKGMTMPRGGVASFRQGMSGVKPRVIPQSQKSFKGYSGTNTAFKGYSGNNTALRGRTRTRV